MGRMAAQTPISWHRAVVSLGGWSGKPVKLFGARNRDVPSRK